MSLRIRLVTLVVGLSTVLTIPGASASSGARLVANAQATSCANATLTRRPESGGTLAVIDAGIGNRVPFICIASPEFASGTGGPFATNGAVGGSCYVLDGAGTDVVAVFREDPAVVPGCDKITSISTTVVPRLDLDCNGEVGAEDALALMRQIAGLLATTTNCASGLTPAQTNLVTVLEIRRAVAGLPN